MSVLLVAVPIFLLALCLMIWGLALYSGRARWLATGFCLIIAGIPALNIVNAVAESRVQKMAENCR
jgi:hypothetical protein